MGFEQKKERAIAIMKSKNMWRSNYAPPLLLGLWKLGIKIPPLPFASFWQITLIMGGGFGTFWGLIMWFSTWQFNEVQPAEAVFRGICSGIIFGVLLAAFHWWRKKANNLPEWKNV